jgi:hypothetical protein
MAVDVIEQLQMAGHVLDRLAEPLELEAFAGAGDVGSREVARPPAPHSIEVGAQRQQER